MPANQELHPDLNAPDSPEPIQPPPGVRIDFSCRRSVRGHTPQLMDEAKNYFKLHQFRILTAGTDTIEVKGPGMRSSRQPAIHGISWARLRFSHAAGGGTAVSCWAELGGVRWMTRFLIYFIIGMAVFCFALFALLGMLGKGPLALVSLAPVAPWIILIPVLSKVFASRTRKSLLVFLDNLGQ